MHQVPIVDPLSVVRKLQCPSEEVLLQNYRKDKTQALRQGAAGGGREGGQDASSKLFAIAVATTTALPLGGPVGEEVVPSAEPAPTHVRSKRTRSPGAVPPTEEKNRENRPARGRGEAASEGGAMSVDEAGGSEGGDDLGRVASPSKQQHVTRRGRIPRGGAQLLEKTNQI